MNRAGPAATGEDRRIRARNKQRILAAATTVFSRRGFDAPASPRSPSALLGQRLLLFRDEGGDLRPTIIANLIDEWDNALADLRPIASPRQRSPTMSGPSSIFSRQHAAQSQCRQ